MSTELAPATPATPVAEIALPVTGMTCASCVARVEKALKKMPGVLPWVPDKKMPGTKAGLKSLGEDA